jgi:hypothetical protein
LTDPTDKLGEAVKAVQERFPGAELDDVRSRAAEPPAERGTPPGTLPPVGETTFGRMKAAAAAEAARIELTQAQLLESGRINVPSETQLRRRDDFDGIYRLIELIEKHKSVLREIVRLKKTQGGS